MHIWTVAILLSFASTSRLRPYIHSIILWFSLELCSRKKDLLEMQTGSAGIASLLDEMVRLCLPDSMVCLASDPPSIVVLSFVILVLLSMSFWYAFYFLLILKCCQSSKAML